MTKRQEVSGMHDGHRNRMRNRFVEQGPSGMESHELLEMLLFYSVPRKDTNELAHRLINEFGGLAGVLEAPVEKLTAVEGITFNTAVLIKMILPLYTRYNSERSNTKKLSRPDDCGNYLVDYYTGMDKERVIALCLDASCRILGVEPICEGDANMVVLSYRKLVAAIMKYPSTSGIIISHNHPGGVALPSKDDVDATESIAAAVYPIGVKLIDHIIVAGEEYVSLAVSERFRHLFEIGKSKHCPNGE